jgi:AAA15 family ATPase/GTPase
MKQRQFKIATVHKSFRDGVEEGITHLDFASEESEGTKKFFRIAGPILDCLKNGYIVAVDELDAKLHPHLTRAIARLFNSPVSNPKNAQLIFATHDTNLLHYGNLRRDQVWFVEKTNQSASSLYSLAEFKSVRGTKVRNDAALEKNYIQGRFGAIPYLGDFSTLLKEAGDGTPSQTE